MMKIMTPGPTQVRENVRLARSTVTTNPDLDLSFYEFYKETCNLFGEVLHTKNAVYLLSGEGILGLEAACASLTEPGDKVLVLDNGIFGKGFADFVELYGGKPTLYTTNYQREIDIRVLENYLQENHDFKYATVVHCDTPSGVKNPIEKICPLLKKYGILTVVDAVSSMFGVEIDVDQAQIDILCGGSQKALSAPIGLTILCVSEAALDAMEQRKTPIRSFYANILSYRNYYRDKWFPYTMPISDIYGLRVALDNVRADHKFTLRHSILAQATRMALQQAGLKLYLDSGYCETVTVVEVPPAMKVEDILLHMEQNYQIMLAGCFDFLAGKVFRIGHMGENANIQDMTETMTALGRTFADLGHPLSCDLGQAFTHILTAK